MLDTMISMEATSNGAKIVIASINQPQSLDRIYWYVVQDNGINQVPHLWADQEMGDIVRRGQVRIVGRKGVPDHPK